MTIPFVDLRAQHEELRAEIDRAFRQAVDNSAFIGGTAVTTFEQHFAQYCGVDFAVSCGSGTDALKLALMAAGIREGDEVITVPNTFIATVEAITQVGAYPVFVDVDPETYNMSPDKLEEFLDKHCRLGKDGYPIDARTGRRIVAILPVHLYGLPAHMMSITKLAKGFNLQIIEDACQAHGATYRSDGMEKRVGSFGVTTAFSFYPGKNLGAMGEAGAVVTNNAHLAEKMRIWRDHGQSERYVHVSPDGWNSRLDALQAAILDIKLKKLDEWNEKRRMVAGWYRERLARDERITLPTEPVGSKHVYHLFVVRIKNRDKVRAKLADLGIATGLHYPVPLHLQPAYRDLGWSAGSFPVAERVASEILSLPMFPHMTEEQVEVVCSALSKVI